MRVLSRTVRLPISGPCSTRSTGRRRLANAKRLAVNSSRDNLSPGSLLDDADELALNIESWTWQGSDAFDAVGDRQDAPPLPLPNLPPQKKRVVLVRHGQSTWNARNRVQGSSDFSILTEEGVRQASVAAKMLHSWQFDSLFVSPLQRATQTADMIWGDRPGPMTTLPSLREIDLYSFQGLEKSQGRARYGSAYDAWQTSPADFLIDGHAPVRELWYRASLAWQDILASNDSGGNVLVVAHNAVNQALICTALGLPATYFRRLTQSNAAFSVIDFEWTINENGTPNPPVINLERLNQFPDAPLNREKLGRATADRLVLVTGSAGSQPVQQALSLLSQSGVDTPPLVSVGTSVQQAVDVLTALQATIGSPGEGRMVVAVADAAACGTVLATCLNKEDDLSELLTLTDGGISIVNYKGAQTVDAGAVLCLNYHHA